VSRQGTTACARVAPGQSLIIDMSALDFIDCSSLGALLRVQRLARRGGGDVVLAAPQWEMLRLLALTDSRTVAVWGKVARHAASSAR
jgi:anti-anti-sigma factor